MSKPHDIVAFREYTISNGETRTESTRIGVAWLSQNGNYTLQLDFLPTDLANIKIVVMVAPKKAAPGPDAIPA
jgi:hypothetical protein